MYKAIMGLFLQRMRQRLARPAFRRTAVMVVDAAIVVESFAVALLFRFAGNVAREFWSTFWPFAIFAALAFVLLLNESGVYQSILRSEEHTSELQSRQYLVCRLLLEKKKNTHDFSRIIR